MKIKYFDLKVDDAYMVMTDEDANNEITETVKGKSKKKKKEKREKNERDVKNADNQNG